MKYRKFIDKKIATIALFAMLIQIAISTWLYPKIGTALQNLYGITPAGALTSPNIGNKIIGIFSGIIPVNLGSWQIWISMFIGTYLALYLGFAIYDSRKVWQGKTETGRLMALFLYGSIALYVILWIARYVGVSTLEIAPFSIKLLIGVAINYAIVASVYTILATKVKAFKFLRV